MSIYTGFLKWTLFVPMIGLPIYAVAVPIPELKNWERQMVSYGEHYRDQRTKPFDETGVWYYDGQRVFLQIAEYTGNRKWLTAADNAAKVYADYVRQCNGKVPGWRVFPHGPYMNYLLTGNAADKQLVLDLAQKSAFARSGNLQNEQASREAAYIIHSYLLAEKLGAPANTRLRSTVDLAFGHMNQWFRQFSGERMAPFMVGLTAEALIAWYEKSKDPRVIQSLQMAADWMWKNAWIQRDESFYYEKKKPYTRLNGTEQGAPDLNMLVAPIYAWLYLKTGDVKYRNQGDAIFAGGVRRASLNSGKHFSQNYRWSFDYVKWRTEADAPKNRHP